MHNRMKLFKHIILSVFVLGAFAAPANAQTDVKALTGALAETIREYANYADTLAYRIESNGTSWYCRGI